VQAQFTFTTNNGAIRIASYTGSDNTVTIPDTFNGQPVVSLGIFVFNRCTNLVSVTIPASITNFGLSPFYFCTNLLAAYFEGNVPVDFAPGAPPIFFNDPNVTLYYLPGATHATLDGLPTALWLPQVQNCDASFGIRTNQFGFNINWASGQVVVVEAATNLASPVWTPVATNTLTGSPSYFSDPQSTNYPGRFYRLRSP